MTKLNLTFAFLASLLLAACSKNDYDSAYVKITSPGNNASFHSGDSITFEFEGRTSGVLFEFDELKFFLYNVNTGETIINQNINGNTLYVPNFTDTTTLLASAEYWREDAKKADKQDQIYITVLP